jgi:ribosomal-protein-alanine N-acetyltransferase
VTAETIPAPASTLEGPRVRLRAFAPDDLRPLFEWYNDPEIVAPFDRFGVDTFEEFERGVAEAPKEANSLSPRFVVEEREPARRVGFVGYYRPHPVLETTDIWYVLGEVAARGRGLGREAVGLLVSHVFEAVPFPRVGATTDVENQPSVRLLEGLGFRREGVVRSALFHHARWHDVAVYGLTRTEWASRRPR